jgi:hypothetical protein
MLPTEAGEHLPRRLRATRLDIGQTTLDPFDGLNPVEQRLVRPCVLHDQPGLPIDRQHQGMAGHPEAVQEVGRVALEVTERSDVVGKIEHGAPHQICIEFDDLMGLPARSTAGVFQRPG